MRKAKFVVQIALTFVVCFSSSTGFGFEDPTKGKPFIPWLWEDQFRPTIEAAANKNNFAIFVATAAAAAGAHQSDDRVFELYGNNREMPPDISKYGSILGSGGPGVAIALAQLYFDQENGLRHGRALSLTAFTHITTAVAVQRKRPNGYNLSYPSGHVSSAFATASSLAYSYGYKVGIPAYLGASFIAASRIADNAHWLSDVVAGAGLGIFWGRASALVGENDRYTVYPVLVPGGGLLTADFRF